MIVLELQLCFSVVFYSLEMYGNASEFVKTTSLAFAIFR